MASKQSEYLVDREFEKTSTAFLMNKTKILDELGLKEVVDDLPRQKAGIDIICDIPRDKVKSLKRKNAAIDIKAICKDFPTFCFEVSGNINSKDPGWLLKKNDTDYFLIVYHDIENSHSYTKNKKEMTEENVVWTKALLIKKTKLLSAIAKETNLKYDDLHHVVDVIRKELEEHPQSVSTSYKYTMGELSDITKRKDDKKSLNMWFVASNRIAEKPINIVIRRQVLESISEYVWEWTKEDGMIEGKDGDIKA